MVEALTQESLDSIIAVVTIQAFTRGKSVYLGKCTSGFIFPWLKGHTYKGLNFSSRVQTFSAKKILTQKWKSCSRIKRIKERFLFLFHRYSLLYFKEQTSKSNFTAAPDFSKDSKTTKSRIY